MMVEAAAARVMDKNELNVNVVFVGKNKMRKLAVCYKNENVALPVLSFPYRDDLLGEVIICYPQAVLLAAERSKTVDQIISFLIEHALKNLSDL